MSQWQQTNISTILLPWTCRRRKHPKMPMQTNPWQSFEQVWLPAIACYSHSLASRHRMKKDNSNGPHWSMLRFVDICECWILVRLSYLSWVKFGANIWWNQEQRARPTPCPGSCSLFSVDLDVKGSQVQEVPWAETLCPSRCHAKKHTKNIKEPWETHSIIIHRVQGVYAFFGSMFAMLGCAGSNPVHLLHSVPQWQCYSQMGALVQRRRLVHGMSIKFVNVGGSSTENVSLSGVIIP